MKVGIVTVYNSFNCGSFLQAYAMQETLAEFGCQPLFIKNQVTLKSRLWPRLLKAVKYFCLGQPQKAAHFIQVYVNFRKVEKDLTVAPDYTGMETVVYGSDTIWNIDQKNIYKNWKRYYGTDFHGRKIAYAISVGSAQTQALMEHPELCRAVADFEAIAVRDHSTYSFVRACRPDDQQIQYVVDPTMLQPVQMYEAIAPEIDARGYILFYFFGKISDSLRMQIQEFANKTGRKIIAMGQNAQWADVHVCNDPYLMLSYYKHADFVITDTFHGNIFSLLFNKQFISYGKEKHKVSDLLEYFAQTDRLVQDEDDITALLQKPVDYEKTNDLIRTAREQARQYLRDAIFNHKEE